MLGLNFAAQPADFAVVVSRIVSAKARLLDSGDCGNYTEISEVVPRNLDIGAEGRQILGTACCGSDGDDDGRAIVNAAWQVKLSLEYGSRLDHNAGRVNFTGHDRS